MPKPLSEREKENIAIIFTVVGGVLFCVALSRAMTIARVAPVRFAEVMHVY